MPVRYPQCPGCGHDLCHIDRTYDSCMCGTAIPHRLRLNFDLTPAVTTVNLSRQHRMWCVFIQFPDGQAVGCGFRSSADALVYIFEQTAAYA